MKKNNLQEAIKKIKPDFILVRWYKQFKNWLKSFGEEKTKEVDAIPENVNVIKPKQTGKEARRERRLTNRITTKVKSIEITKLKHAIRELKNNN